MQLSYTTGAIRIGGNGQFADFGRAVLIYHSGRLRECHTGTRRRRGIRVGIAALPSVKPAVNALPRAGRRELRIDVMLADPGNLLIP